jgi:hypothetical protein
MSAARKRAERKWLRTRSHHAAVLEGLAAAMREHPAGSPGRAPARAASRTVMIVPRDGNDTNAA